MQNKENRPIAEPTCGTETTQSPVAVTAHDVCYDGASITAQTEYFPTTIRLTERLPGGLLEARDHRQRRRVGNVNE